jgi:hypothetical protein
MTDIDLAARRRRKRIAAFCASWAKARPQQYEPRIGSHGLGRRLSFDSLTDEALEDLRVEIITDWLWKRKNDRFNRACRVARETGAPAPSPSDFGLRFKVYA